MSPAWTGCFYFYVLRVLSKPACNGSLLIWLLLSDIPQVYEIKRQSHTFKNDVPCKVTINNADLLGLNITDGLCKSCVMSQYHSCNKEIICGQGVLCRVHYDMHVCWPRLCICTSATQIYCKLNAYNGVVSILQILDFKPNGMSRERFEQFKHHLRYGKCSNN